MPLSRKRFGFRLSWMRSKLTVALCVALLALPARAQAPLSAIDWLNSLADPQARRLGEVTAGEAPVSGGVVTPEVQISPIAAPDAQSVGLLSLAQTGLPEGLWQASTPDALERLIAQADLRPLMALQKLFYTLLLAEALPPVGQDAEAFLTLRAERLRAFGAIEPAEALVARLPLASPAHFALWFDLTLLAGLEDRACQELNAKRGLSNDYAAQIFCALRGGDWAEAVLLFDTADALGLLTATERGLLRAFLDPDYAELAPDLAPPRSVTALEFRLFEAVGQPLPTANLPIAFAVADLRDLAGWKAQLEAAERLVRNAALSPNVLLGLYTERRAAASGGVWERVRRVQALEAALETGFQAGQAEALSAALAAAYEEMLAAGLLGALAQIYAPELSGLPMTAQGDALRFRLTLLSGLYEQAQVAQQTPLTLFLSALAAGQPRGAAALQDPLAEAIEAGFGALAPQETVALLAMQGKLGEAILLAAAQVRAGLIGDPEALSRGIAALRQLGLEDVARRASLEIMLMRRRP